MLLFMLLLIPIVGISCDFSNIEALPALYHDYGNASDEKGIEDEDYRRCIQDELKKTNGGSIFGPFYKFVIELSTVR
jgi:hypothetical protein